MLTFGYIALSLFWIIGIGAIVVPAIAGIVIGAFVEIMNATEVEDPYMTI